MLNKLLILPIFIGLLAGAMLPLSASASETKNELGLAIVPAIIDLFAEPGTTVSTSISIQNISDQPVSVEVDSQSLIPNDPKIDQEKRRDTDASTWLLDKERQLLLNAGEVREVDVQFLVPPDASPGGHYSLITFTTTSVAQQASLGPVVTPVLSSLALITVAGLIVEDASISELTLPFFVFGDNQTLEFEISNTGNVHILPSATIKLYNRHNELVQRTQIPAQLVLPGTIKSFTANWSNDGHIGIHEIVVDISYGTPTQQVSLSSGTTILMPDAPSLLFSTSMFLLSLGLVMLAVRKPAKMALRKLREPGNQYANARKARRRSENKPEDLARLSMSSSKIDDLLSPASPRQPRQKSKLPPKDSSKKKQIIVR